MNQNYIDAEALHRKLKGKIEIHPKIKVQNKSDMSLVYTPGVAHISLLIKEDKELSYEFTSKANTIAIISDGSAVLGLGNTGPDSVLPVLEGKSLILKEFSGVNAVPIILDTQNTEEIISTVTHLSPTFGAIMLEDISAPRCFEIEQRLQDTLSVPVIHDDQHGIAIVALAALINSLTLRDGEVKKDVRIVISGVGAAGVAIAKLCIAYGFTHIIMNDSTGIISKDRDGLTSIKKEIADITNKDNVNGTLVDALVSADVFIGVSVGNTVTKEMIHSMNEKPIIFALANPTPEIDPASARDAGAFIVASGRSDFPNQLNNALVFPGLMKGVLEKRIRKFSPALFVHVAEVLARHRAPSIDAIVPDVFDETLVGAICEAVKEFK